MAHSETVLKQLIAFLPRYEFDALAKEHHAGQKFRSYNRWSQFLAMLVGQLSGRKSLRDITDNLKAQGKRLYHLGMALRRFKWISEDAVWALPAGR